MDVAFLKGSYVGYFAAFIGVMTAFLTSIYSWRLIFKTFHGKYNNNQINFDKVHESPPTMLLPLIILTMGAIFAGYLFKDLLVSESSSIEFWKSSIFYLEPLSNEHPPLWFLLTTTPLLSDYLNSICLMYYFLKNTKI